MGAVLISPEFKPVYGQLGTTFGGNHLACAAALAVLDQKDVRQKLIYDHHCFTGCTGTNTLRLLPPLCLSKGEADDFLSRFEATLSEI